MSTYKTDSQRLQKLEDEMQECKTEIMRLRGQLRPVVDAVAKETVDSDFEEQPPEVAPPSRSRGRPKKTEDAE